MTASATERPILFSGPMVRAILAGTKTQTRRICKPQPVTCDEIGRWYRMPSGGSSLNCYDPPYTVGDTLWVRETFQPLFADGYEEDEVDWKTGLGYAPSYLATDDRMEYNHCEHGITDRAMPAIHMPRWASRILLRVTAVRCERLQEISEADAIAEGCKASDVVAMYQVTPDGVGRRRMRELEGTARGAYCVLWDSINAKRGLWASNPWVWVVTFERTAKE